MQPNNANLLQTTRFLMTFPRLESTQYFCQEVNLPGLTIKELEQPTAFITTFRPGNKLEYDLFTMHFLVNEDLQSWRQIHDWIHAMAFPENFDQYNDLSRLSKVSAFAKEPQFSDGTLQIMSALNNPVMYVDFKDMFPTTLSGIDFNSTDTDTQPIVAIATFRFTVYNIRMA